MQTIDLSNEKLRNAIIFFARNTGSNLGLTKLMKLLYFLDFRHYRETGFSVTGQPYRTWGFGPVPVGVWDELRNRRDRGLALGSAVAAIPGRGDCGFLIRAVGQAKFDEDVFTRREMRILTEVAEMFRDVPAKQMVDATHARNEPWEKALREKGEDVPIDYELIFDGSEPPETMNLIRERQKEYRESCSIIEAISTGGWSSSIPSTNSRMAQQPTNCLSF